MKLKTVAFGAAAAGLVAAEAVNLYKQVMGRGDRPKRPMTRLMEMKDKDDYAMADAWRQKYTDWVNTSRWRTAPSPLTGVTCCGGIICRRRVTPR